MLSPFRFGAKVTSEELVDREREVEIIERVLAQNERLFLIGPRRFGKTSILLAAATKARAAGVKVISVNAEQFVTPEALCAALIHQGTELLTGSLERGIGKAAQFFRSLKPTVSYDPLLDSWSVAVTPNEPGGLQTKVITEALDGLDAMAATSKARVGIIIDEFQQVVSEDGLAGERALRAVVQRHQHLAYVFAGSATMLLTAMTSDHNRPFYRLGSKLFLGPVPRTDFLQHLQRGFAAVGASLDEEAAIRVFDVCEDVPYGIQRLSHEIWTEVVSNKREIVSIATVEDALWSVIVSEGPQFGRTVSQLSTSQLKTLVAVAAAESGYVLTATATAKKYRLAVSTLRRALSALEDKGLLRQDFNAPGIVYWRFEDPFFKAWVRGWLRV